MGILRAIKSLCITFLIVSLFALAVNCQADDSIPYAERNGIKFITVFINGGPIEMVFDTGANKIVLNADAMERLGINHFDPSRVIHSSTANGTTDGYEVTLDSIQAGSVVKYNFSASYMPSSTASLLGSSFLEDYSYFVDADKRVIRIVAKGGSLPEPPQNTAASTAAAASSSSDERQRLGSGALEIEMDGMIYIYGKGWQKKDIPTGN